MKKEMEMKRIDTHMRKRFLPKAAAVIILLTAAATAGLFCYRGLLCNADEEGKAAYGYGAAVKGRDAAVTDRLAVNMRSDEKEWAVDYLAFLDELTQDASFSGDNIEYKLVYLVGDIPALVVGPTGYWVSVFLWHDGEITNIMDKEAYGTWGRYWACQPYQNKIYTYCYSFDEKSRSDYWDFYQISERYEMEFLYGLTGVWEQEKDASSYYYQENGQDLEKSVEITGEAFAAYFAEDDVVLAGDSSIEDMRRQLGRVIDPDKEEAVFLRKVTQDYDADKNARILHFVFSNDKAVDMERDERTWMKEVLYRDITGDGREEILVLLEVLNCEPGVYSQTYRYFDFFQVDEDIVTDISPRTQLTELGDTVWNMEIVESMSGEYGGIVLKMETYEKKAGEKSVEKSLMAGYRDGVWEIL